MAERYKHCVEYQRVNRLSPSTKQARAWLARVTLGSLALSALAFGNAVLLRGNLFGVASIQSESDAEFALAHDQSVQRSPTLGLPDRWETPRPIPAQVIPPAQDDAAHAWYARDVYARADDFVTTAIFEHELAIGEYDASMEDPEGDGTVIFSVGNTGGLESDFEWDPTTGLQMAQAEWEDLTVRGE